MNQLGLSHKAVFQPDMTCSITQYGMDIGHGSLSNGEKKRLNLALCLAFRDTMTSIHNSTNLLLADEIDGGSLDEQSIHNIIRILKDKATTDNSNIVVISHRPEFEGKCERTLTVTKFKGFSSIG
jgi:ABC-type lipoprotein export system ATPase subunit